MSDNKASLAASAMSKKVNKPKQMDVSEIIVLEDDEMDVDSPGGLTDQTEIKCINPTCKSGVGLMEPPTFCLTYFRIKAKANEQRVCQACFELATDHFFNINDAIEEGKSLLSLDYPNFCEIVALDSDDEDLVENDILDDKVINVLQEHLIDVMEECTIKYDVQGIMKKTLKELRDRVEHTEDSTMALIDSVKTVRREFDNIQYSLSKVLHPTTTVLPELMISYEEEDTTPDVETVRVEILKPPADLPKRGIAFKPALIRGNKYYTKRTDSGSWMEVVLENIIPSGSKINEIVIRTTMFQVVRNTGGREHRRFVEARSIAYAEMLPMLLEIGTRVIALFDDLKLKVTKAKTYYPGIVGEFPCAFNNYRYLIFFDDGYALYVNHREVFMIYEFSKDVWEDVYSESKAFIKKYLTEYPNRSMVKLLKDQKVRTEYKGRWYYAIVQVVDCSLVQMHFLTLKRTEWIYRGSRRLKTMYQEEQAASSRLQQKQRFPRARHRLTMVQGAPYVEYSSVRDEDDVVFISQEQIQKPGCRAVAKKSTRPSSSGIAEQTHPRPPVQTERPPPGKIVYYTPRKPYSFYLYEPHLCHSKCLKDVGPMSRLRGYGPLAKPLLCGFYRMLYKTKHRRPFVIYKTPCGRSTRNMRELHNYLRMTNSDLTVDLFDFDPMVRCLAEFILQPESIVSKDLSEGLEQVQIPVVNYVDKRVCDFVNYSTHRTPLQGVNLNLDPEFLSCCDCVDDCSDKARCACWKLTQEGAKFLHKAPHEVGYVYRRLLEPLITGIYECNSRCKCRKTCQNRVVQNPLQHKLQVFMTSNNRGWGIRCLGDIPVGSFICTYAGSLLTDEMANEGGQTCGDEYYAELDFIETVEVAKADYEEDAYNSDEDPPKKQDAEPKKANEDVKKTTNIAAKSTWKMTPVSSPCVTPIPILESATGTAPATPPTEGEHTTSIRSRLRKREVDIDYKKLGIGADPFNPSSDEEEQQEAREPGGFNPDGDMTESDTKYPSVRTLFGKHESVYIMDAKSTGNLGRFLNHSCSPNVFVQNVFVDTHDLRFPWVSFFAMSFIRAGTELTWNYNYDVGSVEDKVLYCNCGSTECKGRLL